MQPTTPYMTAQRFGEAGFSVIPIVADGSKRPACSTWEPYQHRIACAEELRVWFDSGKTVGLAVIAGAVSGNLEIVDVDDVDLVEPFEAAIEECHPGFLDRLITVRTPRQGGRGRQYWYRCQ